MNFEYIVNPDKTFTLYNNEIEDIYFSNIGAHKEAIEKFVLPANPERFKNKTIKILDVCYGLGYNSKSFVDYCCRNNINANFEIDCIELDKNILALSLLIFDENILDEINLYFSSILFSEINLSENLKKISGEKWIKYIFDNFKSKFKSFLQNDKVNLHDIDNLTALLHNIYYQNHDILHNFRDKIKLNFILDDLTLILPKLNSKYDLIFHDAFSIRKQPELWGGNIMSEYYRLLSDEGAFLTYSNSRVLRRTLESIGFQVEINYSGEQKQNGTVGKK